MRKWLVAVAAAAFLAGSIVGCAGCEPAEEPVKKPKKGTTAVEPAKTGTAAPAEKKEGTEAPAKTE